MKKLLKRNAMVVVVIMCEGTANLESSYFAFSRIWHIARVYKSKTHNISDEQNSDCDSIREFEQLHFIRSPDSK